MDKPSKHFCLSGTDPNLAITFGFISFPVKHKTGEKREMKSQSFLQVPKEFCHQAYIFQTHQKELLLGNSLPNYKILDKSKLKAFKHR